MKITIDVSETNPITPQVVSKVLRMYTIMVKKLNSLPLSEAQTSMTNACAVVPDVEGYCYLRVE